MRLLWGLVGLVLLALIALRLVHPVARVDQPTLEDLVG